jgi:general secretion pathway protein G
MTKKGFTLIELLVVIGIIGMLVAIAIPNFLSARQRASDSKKKSDMRELKSALRLYYNDFNSYPASYNGGVGKLNYIQGCGLNGTGQCPCSATVDFASGAACDQVYMKKFSSDLGTGTFYYLKAGGDDFCLRAVLDNKSDPELVISQSRCASACGANCTGGAATGRYCVCAD